MGMTFTYMRSALEQPRSFNQLPKNLEKLVQVIPSNVSRDNWEYSRGVVANRFEHRASVTSTFVIDHVDSNVFSVVGVVLSMHTFFATHLRARSAEPTRSPFWRVRCLHFARGLLAAH